MNRVLQEEFANLSWQYVDSSNLERVAFVPDFGRLWVQFLPKGREYEPCGHRSRAGHRAGIDDKWTG